MIHLNFFMRHGWKILVGLMLAIVFITFAYFVGLIALILSLFWLIWGFIISMIVLIWGWLTALFAGTWLVGLVATITGWITTFFAWFAGTWLGSIFVPIYQLLFPIVSKIAPFFSVGKGSARLMKWFKQFRKKGHKNLKQASQNIKKIEHQAQKTKK